LRKRGFGDDAIAGADRLARIASGIVDRGEDRWGELDRAIDEARDEPWFGALAESDSLVGEVAGTRAPMWGIRGYFWWMRRRQGNAPFIDRRYDPVPTVAKLDAPSLWILGGEDSSMPSGWTLDRLKALRAAGRPVSWVVFPHAEHGIRRFVEEPGGRRDLGYEPDYFPLMVRWLRQQSGLPAT
jgi:pimeloyl-ACP methyl ester carboxylesterase